MKKLILAILIALAFPSVLFAQNLTLLNHYNKPLVFTVGRNADVLPDLLPSFTLDKGNAIVSRVLDLQKQSYVRAEDDDKNFAFFGVALVNNAVEIHGYLSKTVAYSWSKAGDQGGIITFCTSDEYSKNGHC